MKHESPNRQAKLAPCQTDPRPLARRRRLKSSDHVGSGKTEKGIADMEPSASIYMQVLQLYHPQRRLKPEEAEKIFNGKTQLYLTHAETVKPTVIVS